MPRPVESKPEARLTSISSNIKKGNEAVNNAFRPADNKLYPYFVSPSSKYAYFCIIIIQTFGSEVSDSRR